MRIKTYHNRIESREFILSTANIHVALTEYIERHVRKLTPPTMARQELDFNLDGDSHDEAATVTQRFIYDAEAGRSSEEPQSADAVDPSAASTGTPSTRD